MQAVAANAIMNNRARPGFGVRVDHAKDQRLQKCGDECRYRDERRAERRRRADDEEQEVAGAEAGDGSRVHDVRDHVPLQEEDRRHVDDRNREPGHACKLIPTRSEPEEEGDRPVRAEEWPVVVRAHSALWRTTSIRTVSAKNAETPAKRIALNSRADRIRSAASAVAKASTDVMRRAGGVTIRAVLSRALGHPPEPR
jgi:hypothetical protein